MIGRLHNRKYLVLKYVYQYQLLCMFWTNMYVLKYMVQYQLFFYLQN